MKRATVITLIVLFFVSSLSCTRKGVKGTVSGVEVSVESLKRMKEYKSLGDTGYMTLRPGPGKELLAIEIAWPKESMLLFGEQGVKARVHDGAGQVYDSVHQEAFGPNAGNWNARLLFQIPEHAALSTLTLDETSFDLRQLKEQSE
jgi:hypothetical protein